MRILVCAANMYPPFRSGGVGNVVYNVVKHLRNSDNDVDVCVPVGGEIKLLNEKMIQKNIDIFYRRQGISVLYLNLYFWHNVKKFIEKNINNYDIFWLHNPNAIFFNDFDKAVVTMHSTHMGNLKSGSSKSLSKYTYLKALAPFEKKMYSNPKLIFTAVSLTVYNELNQLVKFKKNVKLILNGVDTKTFKPFYYQDKKNELKIKLGIPFNHKIVLSVGRLIDEKQPGKLIEIFQLINEQYENISLIILGDGYLYPKLKKLIFEKNIKNVYLMGFIDGNDKLNFYSYSDYYIMTSKYEGLPLTLLEAMSFGLPCIVSEIPNLRIVEDANCGIVVNFSNKEEAVKQIVNYVKKDNSEHSASARRYVERNFDWDIIVKKYMDLIEGMV